MSADLTLQKNNKQIAIWLLIGVAMIVFQVLLGGITRLTESGLSITEWKPITGVLPPLNNTAWQNEFDKYRQTDQFKYVHPFFSLKDFKFIFFWEWFHRLWARAMGLVFIIGFVYFIIKKKFNKSMTFPMVMLFFLGALQGAIGWLMVKSGLVPEKYFVGHIELTTHFIAAIILLNYTLWFALSQSSFFLNNIVYDKKIKNILLTILCLVFVQFVFGGFMAGLKAAASAPTWPTINGRFFPAEINEQAPWIKNLFNNNIMVQFMHRGMGYLIFILSCWFFIKSRCIKNNSLFNKTRNSFLLLLMVQIILGICTLLNATNTPVFILCGVMHQFVAMMLIMCLTVLLFIVKKSKSAVSA